MEYENRAKYGAWLWKFSLFGLFINEWLKFRYQTYISSLKTEVISNPSSSDDLEGKIVYVNDNLSLPKRMVKDELFGFASFSLVLRRNVEKLQWCRHKNHFSEQWTKDIQLTMSNPLNYRNTEWVVHSTVFRVSEILNIGKFFIKAKDVSKNCKFEDLKFQNLNKIEKHPWAFKQKGLNIKENDQIIYIFSDDHGLYKVNYDHIPNIRRISVLGLNVQGILKQHFNVFVKHGDVPLQDMIDQIDKKMNPLISPLLFISFIIGMSLQYF